MKTTSLFRLASVLVLAVSLTSVHAQKSEEPKSEKKKGFAALDANKDGSISFDEMKAANPKAKPEKLQKRFDALDANKDGALTKDEFSSGSKKGGRNAEND